MNECLEKGIDPQDQQLAPENVGKAVAEFFEGNPNKELAGQIKEWDNIKRRDCNKNISFHNRSKTKLRYLSMY